MSSNWGENIRISIFGESHGRGIGVVMDGLPPGIRIDEEKLALFQARRRPGQGKHTTPRTESDRAKILSGLRDGRTTGTPLSAVMENADTRSEDYGDMARIARPGHADYTGHVRYAGCNDIRGGGHFSGRLTAPLVFAGGIAGQALEAKGIFVGAHIRSIGDVRDELSGKIDRAAFEQAHANPLPVFDPLVAERMLDAIEEVRMAGDSIGGVVRCFALGVPVGLGSPMFGGMENRIASLLYGVPAVKGVSFGDGFSLAGLRGSEANDPMTVDQGTVVCRSNRNGGILGGITNGMPVVVEAAFKPTPTLSIEQESVDYLRMEPARLAAKGRHDPCIVPRAVPVVEACVALAILDAELEGGNPNGFGAFTD